VKATLRRAVRIVPAVVLLTLLASSGAHADPPDSLAVYDAQSSATPIGVISRVPAETDGGFVYASSLVELGKSQATAAGETLGPLGDAFVTTSVPGFSNPTYVEAQYPPSPVFPAQASGTTSINSGPVSAVSFQAQADNEPSATATATGGAGGATGVISLGGSESHSTSDVLSDGTVETTATSSVSNIGIGPAGAPLLTIASMTSTATVKIPLSGTPTKTLQVELGGTLLAGVPVSITDAGISLAGNLAVPATSITTVDAALSQLEANGVTIQSVPTTSSSGPGTATIGGGALEIGYAAPTSLLATLPTDIGSNETIILGQVDATAAARIRQPLNLGTPATLPPAASTPPQAVTPAQPLAGLGLTPTAPTQTAAAPLPATITPVAPAAAPQHATAPKVSLFTLPRRTENAAAAKFLLDYTFFIVAAVAAGLAVFACTRTRLAD
jgi:hypothetical protein